MYTYIILTIYHVYVFMKIRDDKTYTYNNIMIHYIIIYNIIICIASVGARSQGLRHTAAVRHRPRDRFIRML